MERFGIIMGVSREAVVMMMVRRWWRELEWGRRRGRVSATAKPGSPLCACTVVARRRPGSEATGIANTIRGHICLFSPVSASKIDKNKQSSSEVKGMGRSDALTRHVVASGILVNWSLALGTGFGGLLDPLRRSLLPLFHLPGPVVVLRAGFVLVPGHVVVHA